MTCGTAGYSCVDIPGFQKELFVILMYVTFLCCHKSGSHLYGFCTQHKGCRDPTTVCNSTCCNYRDLYCIHDLRYQRHSGCLTDMSAGLGSLCYHCICATALHSSCKSYRCNNRDHLYSGSFPCFHVFFRASGTGCYYLDPFFYYDLRNLIGTWTHQHDVYTKSLICQFFRLTDLLTHPLCRCVCRCDQSQAACLGYCCRNVMICHPGHTALDDGIFNTK